MPNSWACNARCCRSSIRSIGNQLNRRRSIRHFEKGNVPMKAFIATIALLGSTLAALAPLAADAFPEGPVLIKSEPGLDACGGSGLVTVSTVLYSTDKSGIYTFKKVDAAQMVTMCDSKTFDGVEYVGVVFSTKATRDCKISKDADKPAGYSGPCQSGWIKAEYVTLVAG